MVALGFNPRETSRRISVRRVATPDRQSSPRGEIGVTFRQPWVETHGYRHSVAARRGRWVPTHGSRKTEPRSSRSDGAMVALGFNPRETSRRISVRRVATPDRQSSLRGEIAVAFRQTWVETHGYRHSVAARRGRWVPTHGSRKTEPRSSRSDGAMVAVGFNPREASGRISVRRVATPDRQSSLRGEIAVAFRQTWVETHGYRHSVATRRAYGHQPHT